MNQTAILFSNNVFKPIFELNFDSNSINVNN